MIATLGLESWPCCREQQPGGHVPGAATGVAATGVARSRWPRPLGPERYHGGVERLFSADEQGHRRPRGRAAPVERADEQGRFPATGDGTAPRDDQRTARQEGGPRPAETGLDLSGDTEDVRAWCPGEGKQATLVDPASVVGALPPPNHRDS